MGRYDNVRSKGESAAFKDEFVDVLDWDTVVGSNKEGIVYT